MNTVFLFEGVSAGITGKVVRVIVQGQVVLVSVRVFHLDLQRLRGFQLIKHHSLLVLFLNKLEVGVGFLDFMSASSEMSLARNTQKHALAQFDSV